MSTSRRVGWILLAAAGACGSGEDVPVEDGSDSTPVYAASVSSAIGGAGGADETVFGVISGLATADGRIYVADTQADEVRAFDTAGAFLFDVGRVGNGPGEFEGPCCLAIDADGLLWLRDPGQNRYNAYRVGADGAQFLTQRRMSHGVGGWWNAITFDSAGRLIDVGIEPSDTPGVPATVRFTLDSASVAVDTLRVPGAPADSIGVALVEARGTGGPIMQFFWQAYGAREIVAHAPDGGWARTVTSRFQVDWRRPDGTRRVIEAVVEPPAVSGSERAAAEEQLGEWLEGSGVQRNQVPFEIPDRKAPIAALFFDRSGRLWVRLAVAEGAANRAFVYDTAGTRVAEVTWPADITLDGLSHVEDRTAVGVRRDELGVQQAVVLRW